MTDAGWITFPKATLLLGATGPSGGYKRRSFAGIGALMPWGKSSARSRPETAGLMTLRTS